MNYVDELAKVMNATRSSEHKPVLTFMKGEWGFNGICYGSDDKAESEAIAARDLYYGKNADDLKDVL